MEENNLKQLLISGVLGDGCPLKSGSTSFSCIYKDYLEFKKSLYPTKMSNIKEIDNLGFKKAKIFVTKLQVTKEGKLINNGELKDIIEDIDELGLAMWIYDDGSLHNKKFFYNINTHSFSKEVQENVLIPTLNKFNIFPKVISERKKDGRVFYYLYVPKYEGTLEISKILSKYKIESYNYKILPKHITDRYEELKVKYKGAKVKKKTLTRILESSEEVYNKLFKEVLFINNDGFLSMNKQSIYKEDKHVIFL